MFDISYLNNRWVVMHGNKILTREKLIFMFDEDFYYENLDKRNLRIVIVDFQTSIGNKNELVAKKISNFLNSQLVLKVLSGNQ